MKAPDQRMKENSIIVLTERRRKKTFLFTVGCGGTFMSQVWTPE